MSGEQEQPNEGELTPEATLRKIRRVQMEGNREVRRGIELYNFDASPRLEQDNRFESDFEKEVKRIQKRKRKGPEEGEA